MKFDIKSMVLGAALVVAGVALAQTPTIFRLVQVNDALAVNGSPNDSIFRTRFPGGGQLTIEDGTGTGGYYMRSLESDPDTNAWTFGIGDAGGLSDVSFCAYDEVMDIVPGCALGLFQDGMGNMTAQVQDLEVLGTCTGCGGGGSFPLLAPNGSFMAPSYSFTNQDMAGMHFDGTQVYVSNWDGMDLLSYLEIENDELVLSVDNGINFGTYVQMMPDLIRLGAGGGAYFVTLHEAGNIETLDNNASTFGYKGIPQNIQAGNYTVQFGDGATHIYHASGAGAGDTYTVPNDDFGSGITWDEGTVLTFINSAADDLTIAFAENATLAGTTDTPPCTLSQNGIATAILVATSTWIINGAGITC